MTIHPIRFESRERKKQPWQRSSLEMKKIFDDIEQQVKFSAKISTGWQTTRSPVKITTYKSVGQTDRETDRQ